MKKLNWYSKIVSLTTALMLSAGVTLVLADDTEIYTGSTSMSSEIKPNVVFIIDTSGSMATDETIINGTYDPSTTYTGSCTAGRIYYSTNGNPPSCGNSYFLDTSNKCDASATALGAGGTGYYNARAARYKQGTTRRRRASEDTWDTLSSSDHDDYVECQDDWSTHGDGISTNYYPADQNDGGPWRSNDTNAINWSRTGDDYTFYSANYLNWYYDTGTSTTKTRLEIVQEVFSNLMDSVSDINLSVMRFDEGCGNEGGYFIMPMATLTDANRADYKTAVNGLNASGCTPLAETLYEAYLFYKGDTVKFGNSSTPGTNVAGVLDGASTYKSPIEYQCQKNFVILLTDGDPTYDTDADSDIQGMPGFSGVTGAPSCSGDCLDELADYMHSQDCSSLDSTQNVITYTIGFTTAQVLLSNAATKGGGKYYTANSYSDLTDAFNSIITEIRSVNTSFIAPAVSVNSFNRFTHRDELYYALFRPELRPTWYGNVKRYKLDGDPPVIVDQNGAEAVDVNTGFFKETAKSFWSTAVDGEVVEDGGHASKLTTARTIYTYTSATNPSDVNLTSTDHALSDSNVLVTKTLLGDASMTDTDRTNLLTWATGTDLLDEDTDGDETDARQRMGDPLHAKPLLVTYGGTEADPDITLYSGTNEGYLHAVNTSNGQEVFSFIPQELLPNLSLLFENASSTSHPYGLDGPLTMWFNDVNKNGVLLDSSSTLEAGEHVYLYQAMRRGGKNYYALDVSDRSTPVLKWIIKGGSGTFSELAQTWSAATHGKIKLNGTDTHVLIFGGGYDPDQDTNTVATDDDEGRAIYIVNAETGAKIWQAGPAGTANGSDPDLVLSEMTNSIPADVNVIDIDFDGYTDRLYASDTRGQVWRFDLNNANSGASDLATGGVIARLGGSTAAENRRFYYKPDVSLSDDGRLLNIAIGSGYRAHPLNTDIHDMFFVLHDKNVYEPAKDGGGNPVYTALTLSDLYDATDNVIGQGTDSEVAVAREDLKNAEGLYVNLTDSGGSYIGEKVLAKSLTFSGLVLFTTYTPVAGTSSCSPAQGAGRTYIMSITDGTPYIDANSSGGDLTKEDRPLDLVRGGIPPEPSVIFHKNGPVAVVGSEKLPDLNLSLKPRKTHWYVE